MSSHTAVRFLTAMFSPRSVAPVFLTSLANERHQTRRLPPRQIVTRDPDIVERFVDKWDRPERALYFCVSTIKPGERWRNKANLAELICLHADLDFKTIDAGREDVESAVEQLELLPQLVNVSGHGLHCYWLLDKSLEATLENIERVEAALRKLADLVAGDPAVCEAARLMRLPGSHNTKRGEWTKVVTVRERKGNYTLEQLEAWIDDAKPVLRRLPSEKKRTAPDNPWLAFGNAHAFRAPIDVEEMLDGVRPGMNFHDTMLRVSASLLARGMSTDDVVAYLKAEIIKRVPGSETWDWQQKEHNIRHTMCAPWLRKHPCVVFRED